MDLSIKLEDYKLNIRAAGIIIHNNKILLHKNKNDDYYALLGGRVALGESSKETIKREIVEELGKEVQVLKYISTIENFFKIENTKYHEIMFVYHVEFVDEEYKLIETTLNNIEGNDDIKYEWIDLNEINNCKLLPNVIKEVLKNNIYPVHVIQTE